MPKKSPIKKIALRENRTANPLNAISVILHAQSVVSLSRRDDDDDDVGRQFVAPSVGHA